MQFNKVIEEMEDTSNDAHALIGKLSLGSKQLLELAVHSESSDICIGLKRLQEMQSVYSNFSKELTEIIERFKSTIIPAKFAEKQLTSVSAAGFRFTLSQTVRASISDKEKGYAWLRENNLEDLITETVNSSTLAAQARRLMEEGYELPQEAFRVYIQPNVSVTKV